MALFRLKLALRWTKLPLSCLFFAILLDILSPTSWKMPPEWASGRQDAILDPFLPRLGEQNGHFVQKGCIFQHLAFSVLRSLKIA